MNADRKAVIKNTNMSSDMQTEAAKIAAQAMEKFNIEKDIAACVKTEFDKKYHPRWHCRISRNFSVPVLSGKDDQFVYFYVGQVAIWLYKSG